MRELKCVKCWTGKLRLIKKNIITNKIITNRVICNRLMNNALDEIMKGLYQPLWNEIDMVLKHVAIGDDNTANTDDLEQLYNEVYRVPVISKTRLSVGVLQSVSILLDYEPADLSGNVTIKEIGFFAGSTSYNWNSGSGKDTGLMISRIVLNPVETKTDTEQINFVREDSFTRG